MRSEGFTSIDIDFEVMACAGVESFPVKIE